MEDGVGGLDCWVDWGEGGRGTNGEFDLDGVRLVKTADTGGRTFDRDEEVGMVKRRAAGLEEGPESRAGGTRFLNHGRGWLFAISLAKKQW
jgi:hypothetical protein